MVKLPEDEDTPEKRVKKIFRMMDKDENGEHLPVCTFCFLTDSTKARSIWQSSKREASATRPLSARCRCMMVSYEQEKKRWIPMHGKERSAGAACMALWSNT